MRKWFSLALAFFFSLEAICTHETGRTYNDEIPIGRVILGGDLGSNFSVFSFLGEAGYKNYRANGTVAHQFNPEHRVKLTGEFLSQKLKYNFSNGVSKRWINQGAGGVNYQFLLSSTDVRALDAKGYYSYSWSKKIGETFCASNGDSIFRRIAGATSYGGSLGAVFTPGSCDHRLLVDINYDFVKYRRRYDVSKKLSGIGISLDYKRRIFCGFDLTLQSQFRQAFNYYGVKLSTDYAFFSNNTGFGIWASFVQGKAHLPCSTMAGIEISYTFNSCKTPCRAPDALWDICSLAQWVKTPAIYMPEVLAIAEERTRRNCAAPTSQSFTIDTLPINEFFEIDIASIGNFQSASGTLIYSARGLPDDIAIDPFTGEIFGMYDFPETFIVVVTATNSCGSTSQTFTLTFDDF